MPDILHRVGIRTKPIQVYRALTTIDGLSQWWTTAARGEADLGGEINFGFCAMRVVAAKPGKLVRWKCVSGPKEWVGTEITFALKAAKDQTIVLFTHARWKVPVEFMHHCSTKWASFMFSMRDLIERGGGRPVPYDFKIHVGD